MLVFDGDCEYEVESKDVYSRFPDVSIYKGKQLKGRVKQTYLKGEKIFDWEDPSVLQNLNKGKVMKRSDYFSKESNRSENVSTTT